jgi:hypothetical protein
VGDASSQTWRRTRVIVLACSAVAVLLRIVSLALRPVDWVSIVISVVGGGMLVALIIVVARRVYNRGESTLQAKLGPNVWVHRCADPDDPEAWLSVVVSDEAVTVVGRKDRVRSRWPLDTIVDVAVGPAKVNYVRRTCLNLTFRGGARASLALPSRSMLSYSRALAEEAQAEIQRRLAKTRT